MFERLIDGRGYSQSFVDVHHITDMNAILLCSVLFVTHLFAIYTTLTVFCPGFQKGRVPSEKGTLAR